MPTEPAPVALSDEEIGSLEAKYEAAVDPQERCKPLHASYGTDAQRDFWAAISARFRPMIASLKASRAEASRLRAERTTFIEWAEQIVKVSGFLASPKLAQAINEVAQTRTAK